MSTSTTHAYYFRRNQLDKEYKGHKLVSEINQSSINELQQLINKLLIKQNELENEIDKLKTVIQLNDEKLDDINDLYDEKYDELENKLNSIQINENLENEVDKLKSIIKDDKLVFNSDDNYFYIKRNKSNDDSDSDSIQIQWGEILTFNGLT
jgi:chromosome segregation ATPase